MGRTALVTGGIRVIGRVVAETLATHGAGLAVTGRHADAVAQAVHELAAIGTKVLGFSANHRRYQEPHHLAEFTLGAVQRLDILVINAGMSPREPFWDVTDTRWDGQVIVWRCASTGGALPRRHDLGG